MSEAYKKLKSKRTVVYLSDIGSVASSAGLIVSFIALGLTVYQLKRQPDNQITGGVKGNE